MNFIHKLALAAAMVPCAALALPAPAPAAVDISLSVNFGPPALPVYVQPPCPVAGYIWTPGYWGYGNAGYYWIPGAWAQPPAVGYLWTPPYWGYAGGVYAFHAGYWGRTVGFYGGINYGFGYTGVGFAGGYWRGGGFVYNRAVANVDVNVVHNTYIRNVTVVNNYNRVSYNGGPGGIQAQPTEREIQAAREEHFGATAYQSQQFRAAEQNRAQYATVNGGRPTTAAFASDRSGFGYGNEVNTREGNQQSRIAHGVYGGGITPGEDRNLQSRENSINNEARYDRAANGGYLTPAERAQINGRQNNVSRSIYNDRHNANNDYAAGVRNGRTAWQERNAARNYNRVARPEGPHARR